MPRATGRRCERKHCCSCASCRTQEAALRAERARIDERFDPERALDGMGTYLEIAEQRFGRTDLATASYHMGIGNLEDVIGRYDETTPTDDARLRAPVLRFLAAAERLDVEAAGRLRRRQLHLPLAGAGGRADHGALPLRPRRAGAAGEAAGRRRRPRRRCSTPSPRRPCSRIRATSRRRSTTTTCCRFPTAPTSGTRSTRGWASWRRSSESIPRSTGRSGRRPWPRSSTWPHGCARSTTARASSR